MNEIVRLLGIRIHRKNQNHHLWNNHGTWYLHYTIYPTPRTRQRVRHSLETKDVRVARRRRDAIFETLAAQAAKASGMRHSRCGVTSGGDRASTAIVGRIGAFPFRDPFPAGSERARGAPRRRVDNSPIRDGF